MISYFNGCRLYYITLWIHPSCKCVMLSWWIILWFLSILTPCLSICSHNIISGVVSIHISNCIWNCCPLSCICCIASYFDGCWVYYSTLRIHPSCKCVMLSWWIVFRLLSILSPRLGKCFNNVICCVVTIQVCNGMRNRCPFCCICCVTSHFDFCWINDSSLLIHPSCKSIMFSCWIADNRSIASIRYSLSSDNVRITLLITILVSNQTVVCYPLSIQLYNVTVLDLDYRIRACWIILCSASISRSIPTIKWMSGNIWNSIFYLIILLLILNMRIPLKVIGVYWIFLCNTRLVLVIFNIACKVEIFIKIKNIVKSKYVLTVIMFLEAAHISFIISLSAASHSIYKLFISIWVSVIYKELYLAIRSKRLSSSLISILVSSNIRVFTVRSSLNLFSIINSKPYFCVCILVLFISIFLESNINMMYIVPSTWRWCNNSAVRDTDSLNPGATISPIASLSLKLIF